MVVIFALSYLHLMFWTPKIMNPWDTCIIQQELETTRTAIKPNIVTNSGDLALYIVAPVVGAVLSNFIIQSNDE